MHTLRLKFTADGFPHSSFFQHSRGEEKEMHLEEMKPAEVMTNTTEVERGLELVNLFALCDDPHSSYCAC